MEAGAFAMSSTPRRFTILAVLVLLTMFVTPILHAAAPGAFGAANSGRAQIGNAESILLDAANRDRAAHGLHPLQWDAALANAARLHAEQMAQRNTLSHQFPGEAPMQERAMQAGARFSLIAENVAEGPTAAGLHTQWMNSPPHRANLLDKELNAVGIAVVQRGNILFAVEDFAFAVPSLSLDEQEHTVGAQLAAQGLNPVNITPEAHKACNRERQVAQRPMAVLRYEVSDLSRLPDEVLQQVQSGKFHSAAVGACQPREGSDFAGYRIAILLF
jgi:uncharacterized protein YkwD